MSKPGFDHFGFPAIQSVTLPKPFYFITVQGRPRRPETYPTQAAAEKAARELCRYEVTRVVAVFKAEPAAAWRDSQ